ncbi:MAG TPA: oligosaccharide flippase family protein [Spirochaetota bacterium]|nr:oligosaccharide flippase family protein [Spirochaetota bacterium]HPG51806.1 oligosaccharide flippase family protein [Spirochaetota bacterium]HPN13457.1 oligosaccharide flippase family protein [Spirochaetota bacterium]
MKKLIANFSWLTVDRIVRLGINLFIVGWIARYLGKAQDGLFNYSMSLTILVSAIASLGTNNIIIREIVNHAEKKDQILSSAFIMRQIGGILVIILSVIPVMIINSEDSLTRLLVFYRIDDLHG